MSDWHVFADPQELAPEMATRVVVLARDSRPKKMPIIDGPKDVQDLLADADELDREAFWVLPLDDDNQLIGIYVAFIGGTSSVVIEPAIVLRLCLVCEATRVVVVHNHPSGDPEASPEDINFTRNLVESTDLFGFELMDSIVLARSGERYFSLVERGLIEAPDGVWELS